MLALLVAGCGSSGGTRRRDRRGQAAGDDGRDGARRRRGRDQHPGLGRLRRGRHDRPERSTGSSPFEKQTGCKAKVQVANTSDEMFEKMGTGEFDVVSASGDSSLRMIYAGKVAPVNTDLFSNYADIAPFQKMQAWNSVGGVPYGIPHGWGAQLLGYRTDKVTPAPDSWSVVFDPASPYKGKITMYDSAVDLIGVAAVYLMATQPDLKITNPYALDQTQFDAAVALATAQKPHAR